MSEDVEPGSQGFNTDSDDMLVTSKYLYTVSINDPPVHCGRDKAPDCPDPGDCGILGTG